MKSKMTLAIALTLITALAAAPMAQAWSPEGHRIVGLLAQMQLSPEAGAALHELLGTDDPDAIAQTCNWPDDYRETEEGKWSSRQHYINVPKESKQYVRERDCAEGACSAEAMKKYAIQLGDQNLPKQQRWEAWAWVCHLAGDIHQPLHNGFGFDRGGNDFQLEFKGEAMDLHDFWDHALIDRNYPDWTQLPADLALLREFAPKKGWSTEDVDAWIRESHSLMRQYGYPETRHVSDAFAAERWLIARARLALAGSRLAMIVNSELGKAE